MLAIRVGEIAYNHTFVATTASHPMLSRVSVTVSGTLCWRGAAVIHWT